MQKINTEIVAQKIEKFTDGDMFRIDTVKKYPVDYTECTRVAQQELRENARPRLADKVDDMAQYDTVFPGYPNWWERCRWPYTYSSKHTISQKRQSLHSAPTRQAFDFCLRRVPCMGRSVADIRRLCHSAIVLDGAATPLFQRLLDLPKLDAR